MTIKQPGRTEPEDNSSIEPMEDEIELPDLTKSIHGSSEECYLEDKFQGIILHLKSSQISSLGLLAANIHTRSKIISSRNIVRRGYIN